MDYKNLDDLEEAFKVEQVSIRLVKDAEVIGGEPLRTPEMVVEKFAEMLCEFDREVMAVVNFKADMTPINVHIASMGSVDASIAHPREILKAAVLSNASNIMLIHNHPSGNLEPSKNDTIVTDRMNQACEIMGIGLTDHIIVGGDNKRFFSFRDKDILPMEKMQYKVDYNKLDIGMVAEEKKNYYKANAKNDNVKKITEQLEQGLKDLFDSDKFKNYLKTMSKFHNYSFNNTLLIAMQKPDATMVAGYTAWQKNFKRHVKQGEKGIKIFAPAPYKKKEEQEVTDEKGVKKMEEVEVTIPAFKVVTVFDASQTDGEPLPSIGVDELSGDIDGYKDFVTAIERVSDVPISYEDIDGGAKGYFSPVGQKIVVKEDMSEVQTAKTLIHEVAHSLLHDKDNVRIERDDGDDKKTRSSKEVEAESVAYTVCSHFGIDTSDYSFAYVAGWSSGKDMTELKESMETIRKTSDYLITEIESELKEIKLEKDKEQDKEVTLTVSECSEFHSLGECHEDIKTVDEAIKLFNDIPPERMNGIKGIGIKIADINDPDEYTEIDVLSGKSFDLDILNYISDLSESKKAMNVLAELIDKMPEYEVRGQAPELLTKMMDERYGEVIEPALSLAIRVDEFMDSYDHYEYADQVESKEEHISQLRELIEKEDVSAIRDTLKGIIEENDAIDDISIEARKIIKELDELCPPKEKANVIDEFKQKTREHFRELDGCSADDIESRVKAHVEEVFAFYELDAKVVDVAVVGSRCRGLEKEDSDVDVVVEFYGGAREDDLHNILNEEGLMFGDVKVDINPITKDKTGSLEEYLTKAESYLSEKAMNQMTTDKEEEKVNNKIKENEDKRQPETDGKYANFKLQKSNVDKKYLLIADVKYPSGTIDKAKPIAEFPSKKEAVAFCNKNNLSYEDISKNIKTVIEKKQKTSNEKGVAPQTNEKSKGSQGIDD